MTLKQNAQKYIISSINSESYDVKTRGDAQKLAFLYKTFLDEGGYTIARIGAYKAFEEWIMGLPTVFTVDFQNYDILQLAKKWKSIPKDATERQEDKILANYWNFITSHTFQLFRKHKIGSAEEGWGA